MIRKININRKNIVTNINDRIPWSTMIERKMNATIGQANHIFTKTNKLDEKPNKTIAVVNRHKKSIPAAETKEVNKENELLSPLRLLAINGNKQALQDTINQQKWDINESDHMGRTPLIYSVLGDQVECAVVLLKSGADIDKCDIDKRTSLHWAAYQGNEKLVKLLLSKGANRIKHDTEGRTPLHLATMHDNIRVIQALLKYMKEGEIDTYDLNMMTALSWCVFYGRVEFTKLLLKYGASPTSLDNEQRTILHWTSENKDSTILKLLLEQNDTVLNWQDKKGRTVLHMAVGKSNAVLVEYLLNLAKVGINLQDNMERTPLHWAAILKEASVVALLLQHNADYMIGDKNGIRPLHYAVQSGDENTVYAMLNNTGGKLKDISDNDNGTALMWASVKGNNIIMKLLLENNCSDVNAVDIHQQSALHMCMQSGQLKAVQTLISFGADVNKVDGKKHIPLFYACASGNGEIVDELIKHGSASALEDKDLDGRCPLHYAAMVDRTDIIKILLKNNLNPNMQDHAGCPPLHFAAYGGFVHCMTALLEKGAYVNLQDDGKQTALHWACRSGSLGAVKLLVSRYKAEVNVFNGGDGQLTPLDYAILEDHQDVALYLNTHNAYSGAYLRDISATKIQARWRGYRFRSIFQKRLLQKHFDLGKSTSQRLERRTQVDKMEQISELEKLQQQLIGGVGGITQSTVSGTTTTTTTTITSKSKEENNDVQTKQFGGWKEYQIYSESIEKDGSALENLLNNIQNSSQRPTERAVSPMIDRRRSTMSVLSGVSISSKSSMFLSPDRAKVDFLKNGPKFSVPSDQVATSKSNSTTDLKSYVKYHQQQRLSDTPSVESFQYHNKDYRQNEWTTWRKFDHTPDHNTSQQSNLSVINQSSNSSSHSSSDVFLTQKSTTDNKNNSYNKNYSRYLNDGKNSSLSIASGNSTVLFNTRPLQLFDSSTTNSSTYFYGTNNNSDVTKDQTNDKPWNVYRRDQKRIDMIRLKTSAAIKIQKAFKKHLAVKEMKLRRKLSRQHRLSESSDMVQNANEPPECCVPELIVSNVNQVNDGNSEYSDNYGNDDDEEEDIPDDDTLKDIAALVIQLAYRQYIKNKLLTKFNDDDFKKESSTDISISNENTSREINQDSGGGSKQTNKTSLHATTSFPLMQNVYSRSMRKKRGKKFSIKKKIMNFTTSNSISSSNNYSSSEVLKPPLSKEEMAAVKNGKPKLFLGRRSSQQN